MPRPDDDNTTTFHRSRGAAPAAAKEEQRDAEPVDGPATTSASNPRFERLIAEAQRAVGRERASLLARAAEIARTELADLERATDLYAEAFEFAPGDEALIAAAEPVFDRAGRGSELTSKLEAQAVDATDKATGLFLRRKIAARLAASADVDGAILAYQALLAIEREVDALRALLLLLERTAGRDRERAEALGALASLVDAAEERELRLARASLLARNLADFEAAKEELRTIVHTQAGQDMEALALLAELGTQTDDAACLAEAREQQLALATSDAGSVALACSLADLYEGVLAAPANAIPYLDLWARLDRENPQPYFRLVPLLEQEKRFEELRSVLDTLGTMSIAKHEASAALLRAAQVSMNELGDNEGAWQRLVPRVVDDDDLAAEESLRSLARVAGRGVELAELFVGLAQRAEDDKVQMRRWMDAADAYEILVGSTDKALEAALRAFASQMSNFALLDEVDRLAVAAGAWPRLVQVYDAIVRRSDTLEGSTSALLRHAWLVEHKARDVPQAFERVALAFSRDPKSDEAYAEVTRLGQACGRIEDLIAIHERRASEAQDIDTKVDALLEACRLAQQALEDVPRATGSLARAVALSADRMEVLDRIAHVVKALDQEHPPLDRRGLTRALCEVYKLCAEDPHLDVPVRAELLRRASVVLETDQHDLDAAYQALSRAASLSSTDGVLLDALVALATRANFVDALAPHFQQAADEAIDATTASVALRRLASLYEGTLASPGKAAGALRQLLMLNPHDVEVAEKLRASLKAAGELKELLVAIEVQLTLVATDTERRALLEEAAATWETGLDNRFEALAAWQRVLSLDPAHAAAAEAVARLGAKVRMSELDLLGGDLVVRPEDLRPSTPPQALPHAAGIRGREMA